MAIGWLPLATPFVLLGSNLLYGERLTQQGSGNGMQWSDGMSMQGQQVLVLDSGKSCGTRLFATYAAPALDLQVGSVPATMPVAFFLSSEKAWLGSVRLPIDLGPLGWPGCELGVDPQIPLVVLATGAGIARVSIPYALTGTSLVVSAQALHLTAARYWATTNVVTAVLGQAGVINNVYQGQAGIFGPWPYNFGYPMLLR